MTDESKTTYSDDPALEPGRAALSSPEEKARNWFQLLIIVAVACVAGYYVGNYVKPIVRTWIYGPAVALSDGPRKAVEIRGDEPQLGPDDALVTIVEFSDYECPYCSKAQEPLLAFLEDWDGPPVRVVYKNYPLPHHARALPAAYAAYAAQQQGRYELMRKWLFERQGDTSALDEATLKSMKIDPQRFAADRESEAAQRAVDADRKAGGFAGIRATPTFVVNGHEYTAHWSEDVWEEVVEWELRAAKALLDQGVAAKDIYRELLKRDAEPPADIKNNPEPIQKAGDAQAADAGEGAKNQT